jgi:hypothetical protein
VREVYAHFGLCIYLAGVFETGLIAILTQLSTAADPVPTRQTFDRYYSKFEDLTFGNLLKELSKHAFLPQELLDEARDRKKDRDALAHRYFRDRDMDFVTVGGCLRMIEELMVWQQKFTALDDKVTEFQRVAFASRGLGVTDAQRQAEIDNRMQEARSRYRNRRSD